MSTLNHIGLVVKDINVSANFYADVLNFSIGEKYANQDLKLLLLSNGITTIELIERKADPLAPRQTGFWDHITFQVDDIDASLEQLKAQNVELIDQEPRMALFGKRVLFFFGPDGERIEFVENQE